MIFIQTLPDCNYLPVTDKK